MLGFQDSEVLGFRAQGCAIAPTRGITPQMANLSVSSLITNTPNIEYLQNRG